MSEPVRLCSIYAAAAYMSVCTSFVRRLVARGTLLPVRPPSTRRLDEPSRRLLFDVRDLDVLIDQWKAASSPAPNAQLSAAALKGWRQTPVRKRGSA